MPRNDQPPTPAESFSKEDLQALARRHGMIVRQFRARRERERARNEQRAVMYSLAQQMAAAMIQQPRLSREILPEGAGPAPRFSPEKASADEESFSVPKKVPKTHRFSGAPELSAVNKFLRRIGGGSLAFSVALHLVLIIFALFWVVSYVIPRGVDDSFFFKSGSGGGRGGERPSYSDVQASRRKAGKIGTEARTHKIVSKVATAKIALPEIPMPVSAGGFSSGAGRRFGSDLSSGSGGGLGGGVGKGIGVGIGGGRNFVSKFQTTQKILGTNVTASRLAVYMDSSGSMTEVIPVVRDEILKKFPTADVYEFMGCSMGEDFGGVSRNKLETAVWSRKKAQLLKNYEREKTPAAARKAMKETARKRKKANLNFEGGNEWQKNLSGYGKALYSAWVGNEYYSWLALGRWLDMVFTEGGYDSVIVFADFQDYGDGLLPDEAALFERWIKLARENKQRVYFFTTEMLPQRIFRALADYTDGEVAMPKEVAKYTETARETEKYLRKIKRKGSPKIDLQLLSSPGRFPSGEDDAGKDTDFVDDADDLDALSFDEL